MSLYHIDYHMVVSLMTMLLVKNRGSKAKLPFFDFQNVWKNGKSAITHFFHHHNSMTSTRLKKS